MAAATRAEVHVALAQRAGFEVLQEKESTNQLRLAGRCRTERWPFFLPVIAQLIAFSDQEGPPWTCDISKQYILRNQRVLYWWRLIFQAPGGISEQYSSIVDTIRAAPQPARVEVTSVLLPGYKPGDVRGGFNSKGKGTGPAGSVPLAITTRRG